MEFLLWIALAGVIVFLLGLLYSKVNSSKAKQPAANTIPPAKSSESVPAPADKTAAAKTPPALSSIKMVVPQEKTDAKTKPTAPAKEAQVTKKIIPAAEPVGPAHSKPVVNALSAEANTTALAACDEPATKVTPVSEPEPELIAEQVLPTEPELLKKPRNGTADDLTLINGIGKAIQNKLFAIGIFHYDQLADLNELQISWLNRSTGFAGRAERENWCAQAKKLIAKSAPAPSTVAKRAVKKATKSTTTAKSKTAKKTEAVQ
ncbi:hypothetical protein [Pseudochrobactrum asaccharolyticum]|uniref:Putative flap endonuclease-1-like 5' DNA nuclease n=1 Tax=Pseudochrobactrum asaccharolyticum TaxID=354351 RepID=A0A366E9J3_9HYPH|nr:hypothetical protein [Pseudochrobactrum asaccharolyticum]RBO98755.1 putative flap endonuclease-1-like 5' DNA nuclease [Pseudochrobactrum asaccharolyticum]